VGGALITLAGIQAHAGVVKQRVARLPSVHGVLNEGGPVRVDHERARIANHNERAARACEAHVDAPFICNEPDALLALAQRPVTACGRTSLPCGFSVTMYYKTPTNRTLTLRMSKQ
jgi:hypothetical protein